MDMSISAMMKNVFGENTTASMKQEPLNAHTPLGGSDCSDSEKVTSPHNSDKRNSGQLVIKVVGNELYKESQSQVISALNKMLGIKVVMETDSSKEQSRSPDSDLNSNTSRAAQAPLGVDCKESGETDDDGVKEVNSSTKSDIVINTVLNSIRELANRLSRQEQLRDCPICGDSVTGFHYGVQTCESCKGFFKRTVQNKKLFKCHRIDECEIVLSNRKKCPACRFKKCCDVGMKIEGIREDRSRGGRSSYEGASAFLSRRIKRLSDSPEGFSPPKRATVGDESQPVSPEIYNPKPVTPPLLKELIKLEAIYEEDALNPQECCRKLLGVTDTDKFRSMLHITEHRLYKVVSWARNLPNFVNIHTEDQILLLQNAWAEISSLGAIWRSRFTPGVIKLSFGKEINLASAREMDYEEVITRMLHVCELFRRDNLDEYEYVGIKALAIMLPDVKGVKNKEAIQEYQDALVEALMIHSSTHYPEQHLRFGELLLRLSEVQRLASISRHQIVQLVAKGGFDAEHLSLPCDYSLLLELLRHHVQFEKRDLVRHDFGMDMIAGPYYPGEFGFSYTTLPAEEKTESIPPPEQTSSDVVSLPTPLSPNKQSRIVVSTEESPGSSTESNSPPTHSYFYNQPASDDPIPLTNHHLSSKDTTNGNLVTRSPNHSPAKKYEDLRTHTSAWRVVDHGSTRVTDHPSYNLGGNLWHKDHENVNNQNLERENITCAMVDQYLATQQMLTHNTWQGGPGMLGFAAVGEDYSYALHAGDAHPSNTA